MAVNAGILQIIDDADDLESDDGVTQELHLEPHSEEPIFFRADPQGDCWVGQFFCGPVVRDQDGLYLADHLTVVAFLASVASSLYPRGIYLDPGIAENMHEFTVLADDQENPKSQVETAFNTIRDEIANRLPAGVTLINLKTAKYPKGLYDAPGA